MQNNRQVSHGGEHPGLLREWRHHSVRQPGMVGAALLAVSLGAGACGGAASPASPAAKGPTVAGVATVRLMNIPGVGSVLVDSAGHTLYLLSADQQKTATCLASPQCASAWPPLELAPGTAKPIAGPGIQGSLLSIITAPYGRSQVTYDRWPLYTFAGDKSPAEAKGEGIHAFGGVWSAVTSSGQAAVVSTSSTSIGTPNSPTSTQPSSPAAQPAPSTTRPAPTTTQPASPTTTQPASPPTTTGIPQGNGGDHDGDNNGGPSDGDGNT